MAARSGRRACYCSATRTQRRRLRQAAKVHRTRLLPPTMSLVHLIGNWLTATLCAPLLRLLRLLLPTYIACTRLASEPASMPRSYHDDETWADIEPLPQDDGGLHPLAAIAYTDEYSEAMGYLRAVMAKNEFSERVLSLTEHIISMNPAHYTVWYVCGSVLGRVSDATSNTQ